MSYNKQYGHVDRSTLSRMVEELEEKIDGQPTPDPEPTGDTTNYEEYCAVNLGGEWSELDGGCVVPYHDEEVGDVNILYSSVDIDRKIECDNTPGSSWNMFNKTCTYPEPTGDTSSYAEYCSANLGGEWNSETNICTFEYNGMSYMYGTDTIDLKIACDSTPGSTWDYDNVSCCNPECACLQQGGTWDPVNNECTYPEPDPDPCEGYADPMECNCVNNGGSWIEDPENPGTYICDYPELP